MKKFNTAIVGIGFIGTVHIEALRRLGNVDVVAICDPYEAKTKAESLHIDKYYTDYKLMIDELDLDFVHICTPNNTHYDIASYAIKKGIHVVLEKPMTVSVEEARSLVELAKKHHVTHAINFHNRLYPAVAFMKHEIEKQTIGDVFSIHGMYIQDWLLYETDYSWRLNTKTSGITRAVADIGSHWLDLIEYVTGHKIVEVLSEFKTVYETRKKATKPLNSFEVASSDMTYDDMPIDTEDIATITFKTDKGAIGNTFISQMFSGEKNKISLFIGGKDASFEWDLDKLSDIKIGYRNQGNMHITKDALLMSSVKSLIDYPSGHEEGFPDAFKQTFKQIYASVENKDQSYLYATFEDGLRQMILNEKLYSSAKQRKWVKIDE